MDEETELFFSKFPQNWKSLLSTGVFFLCLAASLTCWEFFWFSYFSNYYCQIESNEKESRLPVSQFKAIEKAGGGNRCTTCKAAQQESVNTCYIVKFNCMTDQICSLKCAC